MVLLPLSELVAREIEHPIGLKHGCVTRGVQELNGQPAFTGEASRLPNRCTSGVAVTDSDDHDTVIETDRARRPPGGR